MTVTTRTSPVERILEQLGRVHDGGAWHGPSMAEALAGLGAAEAEARPLGAAHSIREIVEHVRFTNDQVRAHLTEAAPAEGSDWPAIAETGEGAWRAAVERLQAGQRALRDAVAGLAESRLHGEIPGSTHSYWHELVGVLNHDAYHAGQISLLRKGPDALAVLSAPGRSPEIPESADAYGWLVGRWELEVLHYWTDVRARGVKARVDFAWVLEGRAVQDVWTIPPGQRGADLRMLGTTLRVWDPAIQAWRVTWINPLTGQRNDLVGRRIGKDVVQVGSHEGTPIRWVFTDIEPDSFRWTGESLEPDGRTWALRGEFRARRRR
jgi:hypothetical protein